MRNTVGSARVMPHHLLKQAVRQRRQRHRRTGMAVPDLLHGISGQHPRGIDRLDVQRGPVVRM